MARFEEMTHRGRVVRGPLSDLVELDDGSGGRLVAVCHHDEVRADPALTTGLDPVRDFLAFPMVEGLARLEHARDGVFGYAVPPDLRTVRELSGVFAEEGGGGEKASLELLAKGGAILVSAAEAAVDRGLQSHGSLDPWRIAVSPAGQVVVLGYGLPSLDGLAFQADERNVPRPDSLRYFPPERLDGEPEDVSSDLYTLCLAAAELCVGVPVYDGPDLLDQVSAGEAPERLGAVPPGLASVIASMLAAFTDKRPRQRRAWLRQVEEAARRAPGRTLAQLVADGAAYLSDVEDDLSPDVTFADILGPEPEDPRLAALREQIAEGVAAVVALGVIPEPEAVDDAIPEVAAAASDAERARARVQAALDAAQDVAATPVETVDEATERLVALDALRVEIAAAVDAVHASAERVRGVAQRVAAERVERQAAALAQVREAIAEVEAGLEALGEDEEAETHLGAARAALRRAEVARDPAAALRQLERAGASAAQAASRLGAVRDERAAGRARREAAILAVTAALDEARAEGLAVDGLPTADAVAAETEPERVLDEVRAELGRRRAAVVAARDAARAGAHARLRTVLAGLPDDEADRAEVDALRALADRVDATSDPDALAALADEAEQRGARVAAGRRDRQARAAAALATARAELAGRMAELERQLADESDDPRIAAAAAELRSLADQRESAPSVEAVHRVRARVDALADTAGEALHELRTRREDERRAALASARARLDAAAARAAAATADREEPELGLYAADAAEAARAGADTADPEAAAALAQRAEAAADAAEQLLSEIRAEEDQVRRARLAVILGLARKLDARARRLGAPALAAELGAGLQAIERAASVAEAEETLARLDASVASEERSAEERRAAEDRARAERSAARLAEAEQAVAGLEAAVTAHDDQPMLVLACEEARDALGSLRAEADEAVADGLLARVRAAIASAEEVLVEVRHQQEQAREAAERARVEAERARAEAERVRAEAERARAEAERARAEAERAAARARAQAAARERLDALVARVGGAEADDDPAAVAALRARAAALPPEADPDAIDAHAASLAPEVEALLAARAERERDRAEAARRAAAAAAARERLTSALDESRAGGEVDDPEVSALLGALGARASGLPADADADAIDAVTAEVRGAAEGLAAARARAVEARAAEAREREARARRVAAARERATKVADDLVESTIRHEDASLAALLGDTEAALDALAATEDPDEAARLLERVEGNAREATGAIDRLDEERRRRERDEAALAVRMQVRAALDELGRVLQPLGEDAGPIGADRDAIAIRAEVGDAEALMALLTEIRALDTRARAALAARGEAERARREEARRLAHDAIARAQGSRHLGARADLVDRVLGARAEIEQLPADRALEVARELADRVEALELQARREAVVAGLAALSEAAAHVIGGLPDLPRDVPAPLATAVTGVRHDAVALGEPVGDDDLDVMEGELALRTEALGALEAAARAAIREVAAWRSERVAAAVERAHAASARAWAAWKEGAAIREEEAIRACLDEVEQASALVAGATDPAEADWNAALAVAAADRAEEAVAALQDEVRQAIAALSTLQLVKDDAESELLGWGSPASAGPEAELHQLWARCEEAARRADRARLDALGQELRSLAKRVRDNPPPRKEETPATVMSLADRIREAQRSAPHGHAVGVGPTLSPDENLDESGPTLRGVVVPSEPFARPPPPPPTVAQRPTIAPVVDEKADDGPRSKPSVADLQARLRARAQQRTTPPDGTPLPPHSDPPRPTPVRPTPSTAPAPGSITSPTQRVRLPDVPTAPRPIPKVVQGQTPPPTSRTGPTPAPGAGATPKSPASEARTTLMTRDQLEKVLAAALAEEDDDSDEGDLPPAPAKPSAAPKAPPPTPPARPPAAPAPPARLTPMAPPPPRPAPLKLTDDDDDEDGGRTTVFTPSDFGADDDDPAEGY
jgi:hypothetical protein